MTRPASNQEERCGRRSTKAFGRGCDEKVAQQPLAVYAEQDHVRAARHRGARDRSCRFTHDHLGVATNARRASAREIGLLRVAVDPRDFRAGRVALTAWRRDMDNRDDTLELGCELQCPLDNGLGSVGESCRNEQSGHNRFAPRQ
jgi:hypothetical protein